MPTGSIGPPRCRYSAGTMSWQQTGVAPPLQPGEVHVWRRLLHEPLEAARRLLSPDEQQRADRFSVEEARARFVQRRAFLRRIVSLYTGQPPGALVFSYGAMGKPELEGEARLRFNQSDSGDWTVIAVCLDAALGVDVEVVRSVDTETLAAEVFTEGEQAQLGAAPVASRLRAFFNGWTRKEAFIKADGRGLAFPLREVEVRLSPDKPAKLLRVGEEHGNVADWTLLDFEVAPGVVGAVVVQRPEMTLRRLELAS